MIHYILRDNPDNPADAVKSTGTANKKDIIEINLVWVVVI